MLQAVSLLPIIESFANGSVVISSDAVEKRAETSWQILLKWMDCAVCVYGITESERMNELLLFWKISGEKAKS